MDMEQLVAEVAALVKARMNEERGEGSIASPANECESRAHVFIINRECCRNCSKCLKTELLRQGVNAVCTQDEKKEQAACETDTIIALHMTELDVMRIAAGAATDAYTEDLIAGLLKGIPVYVPLEYAEFADSVPEAAKEYRVLLEEKKQFLASCGVRFLPEKELIACVKREGHTARGCSPKCTNKQEKKRLLTEKTIRDAEQQGKDRIMIDRRTIVTDLAKEYAQKRNIALVYCD